MGEKNGEEIKKEKSGKKELQSKNGNWSGMNWI